MPKTEHDDSPTPNGGMRSQIIYTLNGENVEKEDADGATILEYDEKGSVIHTTYLKINFPPKDRRASEPTTSSYQPFNE